jgi:GT2 family glycosyltransferase
MTSIIIPAYNQHELTQRCIEAVIDNTECAYELVLVDNGSTPPLHGARLRNEYNLGFPMAVNQGIRASKGGIVVLLNNDVIVTPGWLERLEWHIHDRYSIVAPKTNYCAGMQRVTIEAYDGEEELSLQAQDFQTIHAYRSTEVQWVIGFCMAFKRVLFDEIGEFDESLWPCSGEEIDFCLKARNAGHRVGIAEDVYVHHYGSRTFMDLQQAGEVDYREVCNRNDKHLAKQWGSEFWQKQAV